MCLCVSQSVPRKGEIVLVSERDIFTKFSNIFWLWNLIWFSDFNFWNFILDFLLQWWYIHSIHWCCCWLGDVSGHLEHFWNFFRHWKFFDFRTSTFEIFILDFLLQWSFNTMVHSFNTFILLLLLTRWCLWTLRNFLKFF